MHASIFLSLHALYFLELFLGLSPLPFRVTDAEPPKCCSKGNIYSTPSKIPFSENHLV